MPDLSATNRGRPVDVRLRSSPTDQLAVHHYDGYGIQGHPVQTTIQTTGPKTTGTRWARVALYSLLGLIAVIAICLTVILNIDFGRFRGDVENVVTEALGREFAIEGDFSVEIDLRRIRVAASGIRLAGADWGTAPELARIGRFDTSIDTLSLLDWPIRIESLEVERIRVDLEQDEAGTGNWEFFAPEKEEPEEVTDPPGNLPVIVDLARIIDVALTYDTPERPQPLRFTVAELAVERDDEDYLDLHLDAALNETPVGLDARAGQVTNLVGYRDVTVDLAANLGEIRLEGQAMIDSLLEPRRPTMQLTVSGPSVEYLAQKLQVEQITSGPLDLVASIAPLGDDMQLNLNGDVGEFALDVSGHFQDLQAMENVSLRVAASGPDAGTIARLAGNPNVPEDPFSVVANLTRVGPAINVEEFAVNVGKTRFVVNAQIRDIGQPAGANVALRIEGPDFGRFNRLLGLPGKLTGPFDMELDLEPQPDGSAAVRMAANAEDVQATISGTVADTPDLSGTTLRVDFVGPDLRTITDALGLADAPSKPFDLGLDVERVPEGIRLGDGSMNVGDDRIGFAGLVGNAPLEAETDLLFEVQGPSLGATLEAFGLDADELPYARYRASGRIERAEDHFVLHDISAAVGDNLEYELHVAGNVTDDPDLVGTAVEIRVNGASLGALTDAAGVAGMPDLPFRVEASLERVDNGFVIEDGRARLGADTVDVSGLIGERPLERDTNLRFDVTAADLKETLAGFGVDIDALPPGKFVTSGEIRSRGSQFELRGINASLAGARATVSGRLGAMPTLDGTDITVELKGDDLASLLPEDDNFAKLNKPFRVAARVRMADETLSLSGAEVQLPGLDATAAFDIGMAPVMERGRFSLEANSPDLVPLTPAEYAVLQAEKVPLRLKTSGRWDRNRWTLTELDLGLARGTLVGGGTVGGPPEFEGTDLTIDLNIASLRTLSTLAGRELPDEPLTMTASLAGSGKTLRLDNLRVDAGKSDLSGTAAYDLSGEVPRVHVGLTSSFLNLAPFLPEEKETAVASEPAAQADDSRVIPDTPIPVDQLKQLDARVDVTVGELVMPDTRLRDILLDGSLQSGELRIEKFGVTGQRGGVLSGQLDVRPTAEGAQVSAAIDASNLSLGFTPVRPDAVDELPIYDLQLRLEASGATARDMAASLDGTVRMVGGSGKIKGMPGWIMSDLASEVFDTVNPFSKKEDYAQVQCFAVLLRSVDGLIDGEPALVLQTDKLNIISVAYVDLGTESIDVKFETNARKGIGIGAADFVTPYTKISGTMASPQLAFDTEEAITRGATTAATLGTSWIADKVKKRFFSEKDPCGAEVAKADEEMRQVRGE